MDLGTCFTESDPQDVYLDNMEEYFIGGLQISAALSDANTQIAAWTKQYVELNDFYTLYPGHDVNVICDPSDPIATNTTGE